MRYTGWDNAAAPTIAPAPASVSRSRRKLATVRPDSDVLALNGSRLRTTLTARPAPTGRICAVSYYAELRPTKRELLRHFLDPGASVVDRSRLTGGHHVDEVEAAGLVETAWSLESCVAAAAAHLGRRVTEHGRGALVAATRPELRSFLPGDVITAVDSQPVHTASDLRTQLAGRDAATFTLTRNGETVSTRAVRNAEGDWGVRVLTEERRLEHSMDVSFRLPEDLRGPSLGLACALAVIDAHTGGTLASGGDVVATGTVDLTGRIGAVGGVVYKARTVRTDRNVKRFLVPADVATDVADARRILGGNIEVVAVSSLAEAVQILREAR